MTAVAGWITAISVLVIALVMTVGIIAALVMIRKYVNQLLKAADPAVKRAEATIKTVGDIAETLRVRTDEISTVVEDTVEDVSRKVRSTTTVMEEVVRPPLVSAASVLAGVSKGLHVWSEISRHRGGDSRG